MRARRPRGGSSMRWTPARSPRVSTSGSTISSTDSARFPCSPPDRWSGSSPSRGRRRTRSWRPPCSASGSPRSSRAARRPRARPSSSSTSGRAASPSPRPTRRPSIPRRGRARRFPWAPWRIGRSRGAICIWSSTACWAARSSPRPSSTPNRASCPTSSREASPCSWRPRRPRRWSCAAISPMPKCRDRRRSSSPPVSRCPSRARGRRRRRARPSRP